LRLYSFRDGKVIRKDSYWKIVEWMIARTKTTSPTAPVRSKANGERMGRRPAPCRTETKIRLGDLEQERACC